MRLFGFCGHSFLTHFCCRCYASNRPSAARALGHITIECSSKCRCRCCVLCALRLYRRFRPPVDTPEFQHRFCKFTKTFYNLSQCSLKRIIYQPACALAQATVGDKPNNVRHTLTPSSRQNTCSKPGVKQSKVSRIRL